MAKNLKPKSILVFAKIQKPKTVFGFWIVGFW